MRWHPYLPHNTERMYHGWMNEKWGNFILCLGWCVMYHELQPSIHVLASLSIHQGMYMWDWYSITHATKQGEHFHIGHIIPKGCTMGWWMKTGAILSSASDGVWCTMSSNHPYRCWYLSQFINGYVRVIYHCTNNQIRGSHPCWPHTTQRMYHGWMYEN